MSTDSLSSCTAETGRWTPTPVALLHLQYFIRLVSLKAVFSLNCQSSSNVVPLPGNDFLELVRMLWPESPFLSSELLQWVSATLSLNLLQRGCLGAALQYWMHIEGILCFPALNYRRNFPTTHIIVTVLSSIGNFISGQSSMKWLCICAFLDSCHILKLYPCQKNLGGDIDQSA